MFIYSNYSGIIYRKSDLYERWRNMLLLELIFFFDFCIGGDNLGVDSGGGEGGGGGSGCF